MENEALRPLTPELESVLLENQQRFLRFLERRVGNRGLAEELLQSALLRAVERGAPIGEGDEEGAVSWFYAVLRNALIDHQRRSAVEGRTLQQEAGEAAGSVADPELRDEICACMHDLLPTLKPEYAELLRQVDLEERPVKEVALTAGITQNNASVRLHRARQALKLQLERSCGSCAKHGCLDCSCKKGTARITYAPRKL